MADPEQTHDRWIRGLLADKGMVHLPSKGCSMHPFIRRGDLCRFEPFDRASAVPGDILLFRNEAGALVGHRLLRIARGEGGLVYICKGDANLRPDEPVLEERVIGRMAGIRRGAKHYEIDRFRGRLWGAMVLRIPGISRIFHWHARRM